MKTFVDEVCRISKNIVWTFPLPHAPAFIDDPGHSEVIVDMKSYEKDFTVFDKTTKTGKGIWIFARNDREIQIPVEMRIRLNNDILCIRQETGSFCIRFQVLLASASEDVRIRKE